MVTKVLVVGSLLFAGVARADTVKQVAQEISADSVLSLRQNVATWWADNLLAAQAAPGCDYCGPVSLADSIASVEKAISLEQSLAGLRYCNLANCTIANTQSTIAINPNAGLGITPARLDFGAEPVSTPEPSTWFLVLASLAGVVAWDWKGRARASAGEFASVHTARKA